MKRVLCVICVVYVFSWNLQGAESLTLDQCVSIALKHNPELAQSRLSKDMAGKDVITAVSNFLPDASLGVGYNHTEQDIANFVDPTTNELITSNVNWNSSASFNVSQSIFNGGYNYFNLKSNLAKKRSAAFDFEDTKQQIIYMVKQRYYDLLKAEKLLGVREEALKSSQESFKLADAKYQVGTAPKSEMLQFKVELENAKLALIDAKQKLSLARTSLNQILGVDMDQDIQIVDDLELPEVQVTIQDAMQISAEKHPLILRGIADVDAAKAVVGTAFSQYLPRVNAWYDYSWRNRKFDQIKYMFDRDYSWSTGVSLSIPLFQGFSRYANLGKAKLNRKMNEEALDYNKRQVDLEVKQAYFSVQLARQTIGVSEDAENAAEETLRLNKEKYNLGAGTYLDLINAQSSYTEAQSNRIQALYDYKFSVARLKRAMGELTK